MGDSGEEWARFCRSLRGLNLLSGFVYAALKRVREN